MKKIVVLALSALFVSSAFSQTSVGLITGGSSQRPSIVLPDTSFIAVGREFNLYYDQAAIIPFNGPPFFFESVSSIGKMLDRSFRWTPVGDQGASVSVSAYDFGGNRVESKTLYMRSISDAAGSGTKNVIFVGDSLMDGAVQVAEIDSLFSTGGGGDIVPYGTQSDIVGAGTYYHEAYSGQKWSYFSGSSSPFWVGGRLDFPAYSTANLGGIVADLMVFQLGVNDAYGSASLMTGSEVQAVVDNATAIMDTLSNAIYGWPDCKVIISLEPSGAAYQSAWGASYGATGSPATYLRNIRAINRALIAAFDGGAYRDKVDVCATGLWVDGLWGYAPATETNSARLPNTVTRGTNFLHPSTEGRQAMADAVYSAIRYEFQEESGGCTNELADSYQFTTSAWSGITTWFTTTGGQSDSEGGTDATIFTATASVVAGIYTSGATTFVPGVADVVASVIVKASSMADGEQTLLRVFNNTDSTFFSARITWTGGVASVSTEGALDVTGGTTDLGGGWYRCWVLGDLTGNTGDTYKIQISPSINTPTLGDAVIITGAQVEYGVTTPCGSYVQKP